MKRTMLIGWTVAVIAAVALLPQPPKAHAQGKGGGRGASGISAIGSSSSRLDTLDKSFELTKDQKKAVKTLLDEAHKNAAPIREGLLKAHAAIGAAVQGNKGQAEIDAAAKSYADQAAAMAEHEMKALAGVIKLLTDAQRNNNAAVSAAFFMMRGAFLDKKWDDTPDTRVRY